MLLSNSSYAKIIIDKSGKGPNGYNKINESHTNGSNVLTCYDPGYEACNWTVKPLVVTSTHTYDIDAIDANVATLVANGSPSGSYTLDGELIVSWTSTGPNDYTLQIDSI